MKMSFDRKMDDLIDMVYIIASAAEKWSGWSCLHIHDPCLAEMNDNPTRRIAVEAVLSSYLEAIEGWVFYNQGTSLYILCNRLQESDLQQIADHILTLILETTSQSAGYEIIDIQNHTDEFLALVLDEKQREVTPATPVTSSDNALSKSDAGLMTRVLLVEDDEVTRWMVRRTLVEDCFIATAACVRKAYASFNAFQPDLVFLDLDLPDGSGFDILEYVMAHDPGARVVIFTSNDNADIHDKALRMGATGFINKPFLKEKLMSYINMAKE